MKKTKMEKLERKGWRVGSTAEFLNLSPEEESYIDLKLSLSQYLQTKRKEKHLTQAQMADLVHSSQSRVAKMEKAEPSVSVDLLVRSLFALGAESRDLADVIAVREPAVSYGKSLKHKRAKR